MTSLTIRAASEEEFATAVDWAAAEGWNPGLDDLAAFHGVDPAGFLMGFAGDEPVSSISVVRYGGGFGFLGFYIVHPDHRGTGLGIATWRVGMAHLGERTVGLDGVVAQQHNYRESGFVLAGNNLRHTGTVAIDKAPAGVRRAKAADLPALAAYDRRHFPAPRDGFVRDWIASPRTALIAGRDGEIAGYGVIRACRTGFKIGPLFADDEAVAHDLFVALCASLDGPAEVSLDMPDANRDAVRLAESFGLAPVFETARMYRGPAPALALASVFGVTTFELG
jgi:hypothetical protein